MKTTKINLNLYKSFIEVYETKNFSNAATNLGLTQPTISYNIKELEKQLKVRLFNSNSRGVEPTKNAEELYPLIRNAFVYLTNAESTVQEFNTTSQGVIRVSTSYFFLVPFAADFISIFNKKYPNIKFAVHTGSVSSGLDCLRKHETDLLLFTYLPDAAYSKGNDDYTNVPICELETSAYASKDFIKKHGLAETVTLAQIENLPVIAKAKSYSMREALEKLGLSQNPAIQVNTTELAVELCERGLGITFGPSNIAITNLVRLTIKDVRLPKYTVAIRYNKNLANKAAVALVEMIKKQWA